MSNVAAVVLAAGRSSRFRAAGGLEETKLVVELDGKPIIRRVVEAALASVARPIVVVTGHAREAVEQALSGLPVTIAFNPDYALGLSTSLRAGLAAVPPEAHGVVVLLGDMPKVDVRLIDALILAFESRPRAVAAAPVYNRKRGNPVILGRALFAQTVRLTGDVGARRLLAALNDAQLVEIEAARSDAAFDVDTPNDLASARELLDPGD
ncbi:MAG TPA: nucleotidyltransferase family protein [Roseiarcus sp.]|nr:nucleotidyltransferase family protein [Roseiarcus sp.]